MIAAAQERQGPTAIVNGMEPLDLTKRPPRGPRERFLGVAFLPRTIDKMRAQLPGGVLGRYLVDMPNGLSAYTLGKLGIDINAMKEVVANAASEDDVVAWLRDHADLSQADAINEKLESFSVDKLSEAHKALVMDYHPVMVDRPDLSRFLDIFEADDAQVTTR